MKMTKQPMEYAENAQKRSTRLGAPWTTTGSSQIETPDSVHLPPLSPVLISPHALAHVSNASVLTSVAPMYRNVPAESPSRMSRVKPPACSAAMPMAIPSGVTHAKRVMSAIDSNLVSPSLMNLAPMENAAGALWLQMAVGSAMML